LRTRLKLSGRNVRRDAITNDLPVVVPHLVQPANSFE
jgi:hypothetical protein